jgi:lipoprotein NlpD
VTAAPALTQPAAGASTVRGEPRGSKVPYSDAALADMKSAPAMGAAAPGRSADAAAAAAAAAAGAATGGQAAAAGAAPARAPDAEWSWPTNGKVVQGFAESTKGIALGGTSGDPVLAAAEGKVIFSGNGPRGYGNLVIVKHANDLLSVYAHNRTLVVKEGQTVKRGQKIAELGESGGSTPRLHFEIRQQGKPIDPTTVLPKR